MLKFLKWWANRRLQKQVCQLQSELEAERRRLEIANSEIESMAAVIARDRERVKAESAAYARQRAETEGPYVDRTVQRTR